MSKSPIDKVSAQTERGDTVWSSDADRLIQYARDLESALATERAARVKAEERASRAERTIAESGQVPQTVATIDQWLKSTPAGRVLWARWDAFERVADERDTALSQLAELRAAMAAGERTDAERKTVEKHANEVTKAIRDELEHDNRERAAGILRNRVPSLTAGKKSDETRIVITARALHRALIQKFHTLMPSFKTYTVGDLPWEEIGDLGAALDQHDGDLK